MKTKRKMKLTTAFLAALLAAATLTGCAKNSGPEAVQQADNPLQGENTAGAGGEALKFRPSEAGLLSMDEYNFPYMGMKTVLTDALRAKLETYDAVIFPKEQATEDENLEYASLTLFSLTEEQKKEEFTTFDTTAWSEGLEKIGALGVYHTSTVDKLDEITGCSEHKELGKSDDGNYAYYLSTVKDGNEDLKNEFLKTEVTLTEKLEYDYLGGKSAFAEPRVDTSNVGSFQTKDINGNEVTQDIFKEYDLTLVNVFTTWCSPCIEEMPELEKLKNMMADKNVNVVGIVHDSVNAVGEVDQNALETAKVLQEKAKLTFPLLMPDETEMNGRLKGLDGFPESFFVDKDGNIVGETYGGARSLEQWQEVVEKELAALKGNK